MNTRNRNDAPKEAGSLPDSFHYLPEQVKIVKDRKAFVVDLCRGKGVLHIGCVGSGSVEDRLKDRSHLHLRIHEVADHLTGVDINQDGLNVLQAAGFDHCRLLDIEHERFPDSLAQNVDLIVIPEVMEHLSNPGKFLDKLKHLHFQGDILISVPNAFSYRVHTLIKNNKVEFVHPDHKFYFSPVTLKTLLQRHGFEVHNQILYFWPSDDPFGQEYEILLSQNPYFAEGIIVIARDEDYMENEVKTLNANLQKGESCFHEGDFAGAQRAFVEIQKQDPNNIEALNNLGVIAFQSGDTPKAIEYVTRSLEIDPCYKDAILNFVEILRSLNLLNEAVPYLEKAVEMDPGDRELLGILMEAKSGPQSVPDKSGHQGCPWKFYYSPGVPGHGENVRQMLHLEHYIPSLHYNDPVWFFGMYFDIDYLQLQAHQGKKIINWRGSDALKLRNFTDKIELLKNASCLHVCQSERQQAVLADYGIRSIVRPMLNTPVSDVSLTKFPLDQTSILVFWRRGIDEFTNADLFFEIAANCPEVVFHVVGDQDPPRFNRWNGSNIVHHGFLSETDLDQLMDQCKGTLRPWESDGTPNIQTKMLLKGRYASHYCRFEHVGQCRTAEEYVHWIRNLERIVEPNLEGRQWWMDHLNNFDFLEVDFKENTR